MADARGCFIIRTDRLSKLTHDQTRYARVAIGTRFIHEYLHPRQKKDVRSRGTGEHTDRHISQRVFAPPGV